MPNDKLTKLAISLIPAAFLFIAIAHEPYGYYIFLRIVVFIAASYLAFTEYKIKKHINSWVILFVLTAILFNPVFIIHLTRETWAPINIICAAVFIYHLARRI